MSRLKNIVKRSKSHKVLIENFSYLAFLQVFLLLYPLITYPYLVDVLGKEIYGIVLTAQMLASYASLFIDFGSNFVCAKHVSINRDNKAKLSEILSNVLFVRLVNVDFCYCQEARRCFFSSHNLFFWLFRRRIYLTLSNCLQNED